LAFITLSTACFVLKAQNPAAKPITDSDYQENRAVLNSCIKEIGPNYILEKVIITGNRKTLRHVILRYIEIKPGDLFSTNDKKIKKARYRLLATGLFSDVSFSLIKGHKRGFAILLVKVKEKNTIVIKDFTFGLTRIAPYWDQITPFGSIGVKESSFLGTGITLFASVAGAKDQFAYKMGFSDPHFLNSKLGLHAEGLFVDAQDYFGDHFIPGPEDENTHYEKLDYRRAGIKVGTGYNLISDHFFWFDIRFENILADEPMTMVPPDQAIYDNSDDISTGYIEPADSVLTSFMFGVTRDTRNSPILPSRGSKTRLSIELSHTVLGSDYNFTKFYFTNDTHFPLGKKGHSLRLGITAGLINGTAPFFDQFFVGDYSALVPNRKLGLNFSNLHPQILDTSIQDMWYEDLVASINTDYTIPFYRGSKFIYGIDGFLGFGLFSLTSTDQMGNGKFPIDITADFGIKIDSKVGIMIISFANIFQLIPPVRRETTQ
jgi:outer membrane protein assembly factor BamA